MRLIDIENIDYVGLADSLHCLEHYKGDKVKCVICAQTVEAIPKSEYEARLKADLKAILVELQLEIHELENPYPHDFDDLLPLAQHNAFYDAKSTIEDLVDERINAIKGDQEGEE